MRTRLFVRAFLSIAAFNLPVLALMLCPLPAPWPVLAIFAANVIGYIEGRTLHDRARRLYEEEVRRG